MNARTARRLLIGIFTVLIVALAAMALGGDEEARSLLVQVVLVAGTIAGITYLSYRFKVSPRRALFGGEAAELGLQAVSGDPTRFLDAGWEVVRRAASVRDVENTATGRWHGLHVTVVDYWYAPSADTSRDDYVRFVCALFPVPATWARTLIVPERVATLLGGRLAASDPGTESEAFNRRYAVRADDRRFASALLDARMIEWIMSLPTHTGFEISDGRLLCFVARREFGDLQHALSTGERFLERVPGAVRSMFG